MLRRWLIYLAALAGCTVFYFVYEGWVSHFLLLNALCLPVLSLLLGLPAMLLTRFSLVFPSQTPLEAPVSITLQSRCALPIPATRLKLQLQHRITGDRQPLAKDGHFPAQHCGLWTVLPQKLYIYDYLGLFRLRRQICGGTITVMPHPKAPLCPPQLQRYLAKAWYPKPGGGYSEHHDLRLYRPGDNLRQIHWKLSAKTGKLVYREPILPVQDMPVVALRLSGTAETLDRLLCELMWVSDFFVQHEIAFRLECVTGNGRESFLIRDEETADAALFALLESPQASQDSTWQPGKKCYILGGGIHETS